MVSQPFITSKMISFAFQRALTSAENAQLYQFSTFLLVFDLKKKKIKKTVAIPEVIISYGSKKPTYSLPKLYFSDWCQKLCMHCNNFFYMQYTNSSTNSARIKIDFVWSKRSFANSCFSLTNLVVFDLEQK